MTVSSQIARNDYQGNGVTIQFPVTFRFLENSHLKVQRTIIATGVTTVLALDAAGPDGYTVTGAQQPSGGTVTLNSAPAIGTRLSILRNVPITQDVDYLANDPFPAEAHERALDKLTMISQQQTEITGRAIVLPSQTVGVSTELPGVAPLNLLRWNAAGTALENAVPPAIATIADGAVVDATVSPIAAIGSQKLEFLQSGTGAVSRTVQSKLRDRVSVTDFGAQVSPANSTAAFAAAYAAAPDGGEVLIPRGAWDFTAPSALPKNVTWIGDGCTFVTAQAVDLPGTYDGPFESARFISVGHGKPGGSANIRIRRLADYTGGTPSYVSPNLLVETIVLPGAVDYEWAAVIKLENSATTGENVAAYAQAKKNGTGGTWAMVAELFDFNANPTLSSVTQELDLRATSDDLGNNRIISHLVAQSANGSPAEVAYGLKISNEANASIRNAISVTGLNCTKILEATNLDIYQTGLIDTRKGVTIGRANASPYASTAITFQIDGISYGIAAQQDANTIAFHVGAGTPLQYQMTTNEFRPAADGVKSLGNAGNRWNTVYATTGTINTSDAREKTEVSAMSADEIDAAKDLAREIGTFQWLSAVASKGGDARRHVGMTVQRAIEIMESHGLDPMQYGFICYDETEGGGVYGFRHDQLNMFIARGFEARLSALESK